MARWIVGLVGQTESAKDVKLLGDETLVGLHTATLLLLLQRHCSKLQADNE